MRKGTQEARARANELKRLSQEAERNAQLLELLDSWIERAGDLKDKNKLSESGNVKECADELLEVLTD